jgi:hypothetical protein
MDTAAVHLATTRDRRQQMRTIITAQSASLAYQVIAAADDAELDDLARRLGLIDGLLTPEAV